MIVQGMTHTKVLACPRQESDATPVFGCCCVVVYVGFRFHNPSILRGCLRPRRTGACIYWILRRTIPSCDLQLDILNAFSEVEKSFMILAPGHTEWLHRGAEGFFCGLHLDILTA